MNDEGHNNVYSKGDLHGKVHISRHQDTIQGDLDYASLGGHDMGYPNGDQGGFSHENTHMEKNKA